MKHVCSIMLLGINLAADFLILLVCITHLPGGLSLHVKLVAQSALLVGVLNHETILAQLVEVFV